MLSFQSLYTNYTDHTGDTSTANIAIGKARVNDIHKELSSMHEWYFAEKTFPFTILANIYKYDLPYDYMRMVTVTIQNSSRFWPLVEVAAHDQWQKIQMFRTTYTSNIPALYHITGDQMEIYPVPSTDGTAGNGLFYYAKRVVDMQYDDYTTGTVTMTNADATVTGAGGATFTPAMVGRFLKGNLDARWYEIASYTSSSEVELKKAYQGTTAASLAYTIGEMPIIPEEYHNLLWLQPVATYWMMKKEPQQAAYYQALYDKGKEQLFNAYSRRSRVQILKSPHMNRFGVPWDINGSWPDDDWYYQ